MPFLISWMNASFLRTRNISPEGTTRNSWSSQRSVLVEGKRNYTYQLSKPGADSNARWLAKCLYVLKLSLLQHQIPSLTAQTKKKINTMSSFILHCYIGYWFTSPSLTGAASNDLKMYQDHTTFKRVSKAVSDACLPVLQRHTWYLTEECIPIALCNPALETETCNQLAKEIGGLPPTSIQIRKPTLSSITSSSTLPDFVGPRSVLLFSQLKLDHSFLLAEDWRETPHCSTLKSAFLNLHPVNDSSEKQREPWRWPPASMGRSQEMRNHTRT